MSPSATWSCFRKRSIFRSNSRCQQATMRAPRSEVGRTHRGLHRTCAMEWALGPERSGGVGGEAGEMRTGAATCGQNQVFDMDDSPIAGYGCSFQACRTSVGSMLPPAIQLKSGDCPDTTPTA